MKLGVKKFEYSEMTFKIWLLTYFSSKVVCNFLENKIIMLKVIYLFDPYLPIRKHIQYKQSYCSDGQRLSL